VALIYIADHFSIIGVVPWREFVPVESHRRRTLWSRFSWERIYGSGVATIVTAMILWTAFDRSSRLLLGYSRVPTRRRATAISSRCLRGCHPSQGFRNVSLVVLGVLSIVAGFVSLGMVIDRAAHDADSVQFIGQIGAVTLLRRRRPTCRGPIACGLYPLPSLVALLADLHLCDTPKLVIAFGLGALLLACCALGMGRGRLDVAVRGVPGIDGTRSQLMRATVVATLAGGALATQRPPGCAHPPQVFGLRHDPTFTTRAWIAGGSRSVESRSIVDRRSTSRAREPGPRAC